MNIFFTDPDPQICAANLDDKRVTKMILESVQMLSTAVNLRGGKAPYKTTHVNHPSNVWTRTSRENFLWLIRHARALSSEHTRRKGTVHKSSLYLNELEEQAELLPSLGLTEKPNCAANKSLGISYKHIENVYDAYKLYLSERWERDVKEPKWS